MKKLVIFILVGLLAASVSADTSNAGRAGAQFLKIGVGSRYQAMGEASVAVVNDVYSMYWNPAGLVEVENNTVAFTRVNWLLDIALNHIAVARNFENVGVVGVSASILSMNEQDVLTREKPDGTGERFDAGSYSIGVSYARQLTARFAFGITAKYIGERIYEETSSGYAFDFGTLFYTGYKSLRMGMSITNMGPEMQFTGPDVGDGLQYKTTPYDLPMAFRVGLAYDFELSPKSKLTVSTEMRHPNDNMRQGSLGAEFGYNERFFLRGGYKLNYDEEKLSLGGGLTTSLGENVSLFVDYSWQDFGRLNDAQRFSLGFTF